MRQEQKNKQKNESEAIHFLCLNRKKQNFQNLKTWDQTRAHYLVTHRKVADEIDEALQNRIMESDQFLKVVIQFLSDCEGQQKKYESQIVSNPEQNLKVNSVSRNIHITSSKCLLKFYNLTQNFKIFRGVKNILKEGMEHIEKLLHQSEREIMEIRTKIELTAVEIQNVNAQTSQKCDKVVACYNREKSTKNLQSENDFFYLQQSFIQQAYAQTQIQQNFGQQMVELLECVEKYEKMKLNLVKEVLEKYLQALSEVREDNENLKSYIDILRKKTEAEYINILYSSEELVSKEVIKEIRKAEAKNQFERVDIKQIKTFLRKLSCPAFDSRNLILKEYRCYLKIDEELQNCYLLVTVSGFMHIYQYSEDFELSLAVPTYSLQINQSLQTNREGDINLAVNVKKWQLLNLSKQQSEVINIVFNSEDQRQQFLQYIRKII